jgi:hypothetical protein
MLLHTVDVTDCLLIDTLKHCKSIYRRICKVRRGEQHTPTTWALDVIVIFNHQVTGCRPGCNVLLIKYIVHV